MIPEGIIQITSVTARKTKNFHNSFGHFIYRTVKPELMFGYSIEKSTFSPNWSTYLALPEKALLDFLYLNPQYNTERDMRDLRLDIDFMHEDLNIQRLDEYLIHFKTKILETRVSRLKGAYL